LLLRLYEDRSLLRGVRLTMSTPPTMQEVLGQHLSLYAWVASAAQTAARV
jgi:hypothetical protein